MTPKVTPTSVNQQPAPDSESEIPDTQSPEMSPDNILIDEALAPPEQVKNPSKQTNDTPNNYQAKTCMSRAMRALKSHNKPGLKETEPLPERRL